MATTPGDNGEGYPYAEPHSREPVAQPGDPGHAVSGGSPSAAPPPMPASPLMPASGATWPSTGPALAMVPPRPPKVVGPVILVLVLAIVLQLAVGCVAGLFIALAVKATDVDADADAIHDFINSPNGFSVMALVAQAAFLLVALAAARRLPGKLVDNLGMRRPRCTGVDCAVLTLGGIAVAGVGLIIARVLTQWLPAGTESVDVSELHHEAVGTSAVVLVATIALAPGFIEEMLFRGYALRALLRRWPAWAAILLTSVIFAVAHLNPVQAAFAWPLGVWLGVVAWRTGSIWPGIFTHIAVNAFCNVFGIWTASGDGSPLVQGTVLLFIALLSFVCFIMSIVLLTRTTPPPLPAWPVAAAGADYWATLPATGPATAGGPIPVGGYGPIPVAGHAPVPIAGHAPIPIAGRAPVPIAGHAPAPIPSPPAGYSAIPVARPASSPLMQPPEACDPNDFADPAAPSDFDQPPDAGGSRDDHDPYEYR